MKPKHSKMARSLAYKTPKWSRPLLVMRKYEPQNLPTQYFAGWELP